MVEMFFAALILGFVGSLHCAAMCGPLVLAVPVVGSTKTEILTSRLVYNLGRIISYTALGLIFGVVGKSLLMAGFQRWLSIASGAIMLAHVFYGRKSYGTALSANGWLKSVFRKLLQWRSLGGIFALGAINGLLPCGLVYVAGAASVTAGSIAGSAAYMFFFGLGTIPMLLGMSLCGAHLTRFVQRFRLKPLVALTVTLVAASLILRGLALGIPFVSPTVFDGDVRCSACLKH